MRRSVDSLATQARIRIAFCQLFARDHLGDDQAGTKPVREPAKGHIRHTGHGRKECPVRDRHAADHESVSCFTKVQFAHLVCTFYFA